MVVVCGVCGTYVVLFGQTSHHHIVLTYIHTCRHTEIYIGINLKTWRDKQFDTASSILIQPYVDNEL